MTLVFGQLVAGAHTDLSCIIQGDMVLSLLGGRVSNKEKLGMIYAERCNKVSPDMKSIGNEWPTHPFLIYLRSWFGQGK